MQLSHSKAEARALQGARQQPCALPRARGGPHAVPCNNLSAPSAAPRGAVNAACADSVRARVIARVAAAERPTMEAGQGACAPSVRPLKVVIAGAGIGGLVLALALIKKGVQVEVYERDLTAIRGEGKYRGPIQVGCHRGCWRAGRSGAAHGAASAAAQRRTPPPANASRHRHTPELPGPRPRWKSISPRMLSCAAGRTGGCSGRMPPGGGAGCWRAHGLGHQTAASARPPGPTGAIQRPGSAGGHRPLLRPQGHGGGLHHGRPHQRPVRWRVRRLVGGPTPRWRRARTLVGYQPPSQPASAQVKPRLRARTLDARGAEQLPGRRARVAPVPPPLPLGIVPSHGAYHSAPGCPPPPPPAQVCEV